jgi:hypothetical protein
MSSPRPARHTSLVASLFAALAIAGVVACAQGTNGSDDDIQNVDARTVRIDARATDARPPDAPLATDARPPDGGLPGTDGGLPGLDGGLGGMCTQNSDCTTAGECCVFGLLCAPGTPAPPPINCIPGN